MGHRDIGTDDPRVKVRPGKGSRPRSKRRPDYSNKPTGQVIGIDRGRYTVVVKETDEMVQCVKARELGRGGVVIGDQVHLTGDLSGDEGSLARIVQILPREHVLRRSLEEAAEGRGEKIIVTGADQLVIVSASADPEPRIGMVERCLVAAKESDIKPILCMTKCDLADPTQFISQFKGFDLTVVTTSLDEQTSSEPGKKDPGFVQLKELLQNKFSVLVGHSGVGKSTLINALVPGAGRSTGAVNHLTGKGRHTSTSALAFPLPDGGWVVDTPGVRSFGLSHASVQDVLEVFPGTAKATQYCLPLCDHLESAQDCALDHWSVGTGPFSEEKLLPEEILFRKEMVERTRGLLESVGNDSFN